MIFSNTNSLEDFIVENLIQRSYKADELLKEYNSKHKKVTIQAVYKSLKKLAEDEIVLKHKDSFSLNNVWKGKVLLNFQNSNSIRLQEGESIQYSFKSLDQLDEYWKHIQEGLDEKVEIIYFFCPHQYWWFVPGRRESEINFYKHFQNNDQKAVLLLGGNTVSDKKLRDVISNQSVQVHTEPNHGLRMTDNLTIKGDLIIRTRLPLSISNKINSVFNQSQSVDDTEKRLQDLFVKKIPVKILIEKNRKKAEKLSKQIGKYFFIKDSL